jgi:hypothetical protein
MRHLATLGEPGVKAGIGVHVAPHVSRGSERDRQPVPEGSPLA